MKHKPWLSFLPAVARPACSAMALTCGFSNSPMEEGAAELGLVQLAQKVTLVFVVVEANFEVMDALIVCCASAIMACGHRICAQFQGGVRKRSNFTSRLQSTSGLGVRPAAYSSNM